MAGSPAAQRRQKWIERRVRQLLEERYPLVHVELRAQAAAEWDNREQPDYLARLEAATDDVRAALAELAPGLPDEPPYEQEQAE